MKSTDWSKLAPSLLFFIGTLVAAVIRGRENPEVFRNTLLFVVAPMVLIMAVAYLVIERRSRARSERTWEIMEKRHPGEVMYLFPVFPRTRAGLARLGLPTKSGAVSYPMIGVVFGSEVTFWEEGNNGPSLGIPCTDIEAVEHASMQSGTRRFPAIRLLLAGHVSGTSRGPDGGDLVLSLRRRGHKRLSEEERTHLVRELNSRLKLKRHS